MRLPLPTRLRTRFIILCIAIAGLVFGVRPALISYRLYQARAALERRDAERALVQLRSAERLGAGHAETHFLLARVYRRLGRFDLVRERLARAAKLGWPVAQLEREQWLALAQAGQWRQAEPHLPELLRNPRDDGPSICEAFVDGYFATYQFAKAFLLLDGWQKEYPGDPQPHVFRGLFLEHAGAWADARPHYQSALERAPYRTDVRLRLARLLMRLQEYDDAAAHFERCLREKPDDPDVLVGWGKCLQRRGQPQESRRYFLEALDRDSRHFDARLALGQLEQSLGHHREARRWLEQACRERPHDTEARYALAKMLQSQGQPESAKDHFRFVAEARDALADLPVLMERVRNNPDDPEARYRIGGALLKFDDPTHGVAWLRSVLEIRPHDRATHELLADYYSEKGNSELAGYHRQRAAPLEDRS